MTHKTFTIGIAGWGLAGRYFHAPLIKMLPGFELDAVVTSRQPNRSLFPNLTILDSFEKLLNLEEIDIVVIATPNHLHFAQAKAALGAGKHVVIEKPMATSLEQVQALYQLAKQNNRFIFPFQNRRWDGDFLTLQSLIESGTIGRLYHLESRWLYYRPDASPRAAWKADPEMAGGVLYDLAPHLIDQMIVLLGKPEALSARIDILHPERDVHDFFRIEFYYPGKVTVLLEVDTLNAVSVPRFQARGTTATFEKHGLDQQEKNLHKDKIPEDDSWRRDPPGQWGHLRGKRPTGEPIYRIVETLPGQYPNFYRAVYQSLTEAKVFPITSNDILTQFEILEAALESSSTNRVVRLSK